MLACIFTHRDEAIFHHITLMFENKLQSQIKTNPRIKKTRSNITQAHKNFKQFRHVGACTQVKAVTKGGFTFRVFCRALRRFQRALALRAPLFCHAVIISRPPAQRTLRGREVRGRGGGIYVWWENCCASLLEHGPE